MSGRNIIQISAICLSQIAARVLFNLAVLFSKKRRLPEREGALMREVIGWLIGWLKIASTHPCKSKNGNARLTTLSAIKSTRPSRLLMYRRVGAGEGKKEKNKRKEGNTIGCIPCALITSMQNVRRVF